MTLSEMWIIPTFKPHFHFHTWREWRNKDQCYLCYYFNARKGSK